MSPDILLQLALFAFAASATPGPNNVILTAAGAQFGIRRGLPVLAGIICGFAAMNFILSISLGGAAAQIEAIRLPMRLVGIGLLFWLCWKIAVAPVGDGHNLDEHGEVPIKKPMGFVAGALFQWVNPKAWMIVAAAISTFTDPLASPLIQAFVFAIVMFLAGVLGASPWLFLGALLRRWLKNPRFARGFNWTMALLLLVSVVPMLFD